MSVAVTDKPDEIVAELERDYISWSAISSYQQCPLKYFFRYVAKLPKDTVSAALIFGGAIHRAVELHFLELLAGNPAPDVDMLLAEYQAAWSERSDVPVQFGKNDSIDSLGVQAERMLLAFQQSELSQPHGRILAVEEELRGEVIPECPDLLARVDLIIDSEEALTVTDLKTARSRWSQAQVEASAEQLLLYSELARELAPGKDLRPQFAVVTKAKKPTVNCHEVAVDTERLHRTKRIVQRVWRSIQAGHFYPSPSQMNCATCPYKEPCREWRG